MGQIDFSAPVCDPVLNGIKPILISPANVTPNPFEDILTIDLGSEVRGRIRVEIYSLSGQMVFSKSENTASSIDIDLSGKTSGLYTGKIISDGKISVFRAMKI